MRCRGGVIAVFVVVATLASACSGSGSASASDVAGRFVRAWNGRDYAAMARLLEQRPAGFASYHKQVLSNLDASTLVARVADVKENGDQATARLTNHFRSTFGDWDTRGTLTLVKQRGDWRVRWTHQQISDALAPDARLSVSVDWPDRAPVLGAGGQPLTTLTPMVHVGVQGSRVTDTNTITAALTLAGATSDQITKALATAKDHPDWFVPVVDVPDAQYQQLKAQIYPVPGTVFQTFTARQALTPGLAAHLVGSVGPITAEQLSKLGPPYRPTDVVGRSGLEAQAERQLAGTPGATVRVLDTNNKTLATLATFPAKMGSAVQTTLDPVVQRAAEGALTGVNGEAAIVAIRPSTGEVLASASVPTTNQYDIALRGRYPPGSAFKIVTTTDLLEHGLSPSSTVSCPPSLTVGGQTFHNFEGEAAASLSLADAFATSCNNAFINTAKDLPADTLPATAAAFGLGTTEQTGVDTYGGSVPTPTSPNEQAATAIGQAKVTASPLAMASVAATVATGAWHAPRLVVGAPNDTVAPKPLDASIAASLQQMMAAVVTRGTAAGAGLPPGTYGKTGTAEFGSGNPPPTHAWFIGYRNNLAFAVIVEGGGVGGQVAAPIAARFLNSL